MGTEYLIWIGSLALFILGWYYFTFFYVKRKRYFIPYIVFQLGLTLFVVSIFIIGRWVGMGLGIISLLIMGLGSFSLDYLFSFTHNYQAITIPHKD